jgi:hypothetical protein
MRNVITIVGTYAITMSLATATVVLAPVVWPSVFVVELMGTYLRKR